MPNAPPPAAPPPGPAARSARRLGACHRTLRARADAHPRVAERVDDDHRLGFALGDEVVHDVVRAARQHPARVDVAGAVQQVEDGVARVAALVAGRRVDPERARHAEGLRMVGLDAHRAVRHVARVIELVAGHLEHARRRERAESELHRRVPGIHRDDAVGVELVVVDVGRERPDRHRPDAVLALGHRVGLAVELADERDFLRVRRAEAQCHRLVGVDLGRHDRRAAASAASSLRCRRAGGAGACPAGGVCPAGVCALTAPTASIAAINQ